MHSLSHIEHARQEAAERLRRPVRTRGAEPQPRPPSPLRAGLARMTARLAGKLDAESARRIIA